MRDWSLGPGDPLCLTLAADARLSSPDYINDHTWELEMGGGEPATLALRTTYGLRARSMRIFLRFSEGGKSVTDPSAFALPPRLRRFYPNFFWFEFAPFENLEASAEYWIPHSNAAAGRITMANHTTANRRVRLEVCAALTPLDGQPMTGIQMQLVNVLAGQAGGLFPILFLTGGPAHGTGPHPSLMLDLDLGPGAMRQLTWAQAARDTLQGSFDLARQTAARPWEAERARIELLNTSQAIDIRSGDKDWDAAFAFSQSAAFRLFFPANKNLPHPSIVISRQPDNGFSRKGDGSDLPAAWSGQTPLETFYLSSLFPAAPELAKGLLKNFLSTQSADGFIDHRLGIAGQRSRLLAMPILASLAWQLYQSTEDETFLNEVFPKLIKFFWAWFSPERDADRDGIPQWRHVLQTGFEDNPLFDTWHPWSQGADITKVHSPALVSMLYREASCLIQMAEHLNQVSELNTLHAQAALLRKSVEDAWNAHTAAYHYRDCESGFAQTSTIILRRNGAGVASPKVKFEQGVRLLIEVRTESPAAKRPEIRIHEVATKAASEIISADQFHWHSGGLAATTQRVYTRLGKVSVRGLSADDEIVVRTVDLTREDITLFTPLWAGLPDLHTAQMLIGNSLLRASRFDRPFGIPASASLPTPNADPVLSSVHLPWNQLVGEGLLRYGFRAEAARLTAHLMNAVIQNLKQNRAFYARYHAEKGTGIGERNALTGLAPVGLFLRVLGVEILSPTRVRLEGQNPFPWNVEISYKGLKVLRGLEKTEITFPNGRKSEVTDTAPCLVSM